MFLFSRNYYDVYASTLEKDEECASEQEEVEESLAVNEGSAVTTATATTTAHDTHVHFSIVSAAEILGCPVEAGSKSKAHDEDKDTDANSCYYSASASHTDNYCSTDEHEHHVVGNRQQVAFKPTAIREVRPNLHSSDSGADISENHLLGELQRLPETEEPRPEQGQDSKDRDVILPEEEEVEEDDEEEAIPPTVLHERNNSLPNVLCPDELATEWETYWSRHGEQLIWASWIEKYSDYIDPAYKEGFSGVQLTQNAHELESVMKSDKSDENKGSFDCSTGNTLNDKTNIFTFDEEEIEGHDKGALNLVLPSETETATAATTEIVVSNCSPGVICGSGSYHRKRKITEGVVPGGQEQDLDGSFADDGEVMGRAAGEIWGSYRTNRLSIDERLLSPRCDSVNSSIPCGGAATDSMTNVTRMTISSCEFCSSKVTSESSQNNSMTTSTRSNSESEAEGEDNGLVTQHSQFYDAVDCHHGVGKLDPGAAGQRKVPPAEENAMDVDQYWQVLWEKHFQVRIERC